MGASAMADPAVSGLGRLALILQPWLRAWDGYLPATQRFQIELNADAIPHRGPRAALDRSDGHSPSLPPSSDHHRPRLVSGCQWLAPAGACGSGSRASGACSALCALVFAVSEGMAREIGTTPTSRFCRPVFFPIPDLSPTSLPSASPTAGPWRLFTQGSAAASTSPCCRCSSMP